MGSASLGLFSRFLMDLTRRGGGVTIRGVGTGELPVDESNYTTIRGRCQTDMLRLQNMTTAEANRVFRHHYRKNINNYWAYLTAEVVSGIGYNTPFAHSPEQICKRLVTYFPRFFGESLPSAWEDMNIARGLNPRDTANDSKLICLRLPQLPDIALWLEWWYPKEEPAPPQPQPIQYVIGFRDRLEVDIGDWLQTPTRLTGRERAAATPRRPRLRLGDEFRRIREGGYIFAARGLYPYKTFGSPTYIDHIPEYIKRALMNTPQQTILQWATVEGMIAKELVPMRQMLRTRFVKREGLLETFTKTKAAIKMGMTKFTKDLNPYLDREVFHNV